MNFLPKRFLLLSLVAVFMLVFAAACGGGTAEQPEEAPAAEEGTEAEAPAEEGTTDEEMPMEEETPAEEEGTTDEEMPMEEETPAEEEGATDEEEAPAAAGDASLDSPPSVPNAEEASQYTGASIVYYGGTTGLEAEIDDALVAQFTEDTGIEVEIVRRPQSPTDTINQYQQLLANQSPDLDVIMLDVIWPGLLADNLLDLGPALGDVASEHIPSIVENSTIDGKLVGIPWFTDWGMLYYRTDLLEKYGYDGPPATWDELEEMSQAVQEGERGEGNDNFYGFVWQGNANESLTCNALEWVYSHGGGRFIDDGGAFTFDNEATVTALTRAQGWVGTISPDGVTTYGEEEARPVFEDGNALFMRNWPYAYATGLQSGIADDFAVAPLPSVDGEQKAGTLGGWGLGISQYSENPEAAIEFVRYVTSPEVLKWRALVGTYAPTNEAVLADPEVLEALPYLEVLDQIEVVARPSGETGANYNEVSTTIFQNVNQILRGQDAVQLAPRVNEQLQQAAER
ncbi:MAG: ABC transporter substrate-binding protein [Chloroflexi bacterium AL-W]|nr:ABC transporter substrate-binding protein [Chloroflexi bacterium AL-N1]NOK70340.1 ABC transporter substrate-binding protein [Chloroflexi bacterium AL-N10]NOK78018.1 ABC transporter substrate-binding protein [Chloroflexi bacterium AL-N5]NOK85117.1 ABC transporter substrate-binding protein [Chloroflexi bacterium AL-W]NOK92106.1 ABC transporter substrate-binding protein [Chloroflexi bacterium AL-N15]